MCTTTAHRPDAGMCTTLQARVMNQSINLSDAGQGSLQPAGAQHQAQLPLDRNPLANRSAAPCIPLIP